MVFLPLLSLPWILSCTNRHPSSLFFIPFLTFHFLHPTLVASSGTHAQVFVSLPSPLTFIFTFFLHHHILENAFCGRAFKQLGNLLSGTGELGNLLGRVFKTSSPSSSFIIFPFIIISFYYHFLSSSSSFMIMIFLLLRLPLSSLTINRPDQVIINTSHSFFASFSFASLPLPMMITHPRLVIDPRPSRPCRQRIVSEASLHHHHLFLFVIVEHQLTIFINQDFSFLNSHSHMMRGGTLCAVAALGGGELGKLSWVGIIDT